MRTFSFAFFNLRLFCLKAAFVKVGFAIRLNVSIRNIVNFNLRLHVSSPKTHSRCCSSHIEPHFDGDAVVEPVQIHTRDNLAHLSCAEQEEGFWSSLGLDVCRAARPAGE